MGGGKFHRAAARPWTGVTTCGHLLAQVVRRARSLPRGGWLPDDAVCGSVVTSHGFFMIGAAKDLMVSKAAKTYLSGFIERYGEVRDFKIDSSRNRIELMCMLNGEHEPIGITIEKYMVEQE